MRTGDTAIDQVVLPPDTRRWQVAYRVSEMSPGAKLYAKVGAKWFVRITSISGDLISSDEKETLVWGPIIEMNSALKTDRGESPKLVH
jgi:hypothetical protein